MFGDECVCQRCGRHYVHDWKKGHTARWCNSCRNTFWRDRRALKQRMVDYKGGCCQLCGYRRCLRALDFHHLDPSQKRFTVAQNHQRSWEALREELDGCMLVCSNCHFGFEGHGGRPRFDDPNADSVCERCGRRYVYDRRKGSTRRRCNSCVQSRPSAEERQQLKRRMVEYKGGACQICGYNKRAVALTFHHVDPRLKRFNIAGSHNRKFEALREELDRCVLVCANCHDEIEDGMTEVPYELAAAIHSQTKHLTRLERRPAGRPRLS